MFAIKNFTDNDDVRVLGSMGPFTVVEYLKDLSVTPSTAMTAYYCNEMNVRKRQVICDLSKANITLQAGAMQWMAGNVNATTGLKGVGDFFGKAVRGKVTGESAVKPEYTGNGIMKRLMIQGLTQIPCSRLTGDPVNRLPGTASFVFEGVEGEALLLHLDARGICASSGSACSSASLDPSHVLLAIGLPHAIAHGSLRLSLGAENTEADVDYILKEVPQVVAYLRELSPVWDRDAQKPTWEL